MRKEISKQNITKIQSIFTAGNILFLLLFLGAIAVHVYTIHTAPIELDAGYWLYEANQLLGGERPMRDFYSRDIMWHAIVASALALFGKSILVGRYLVLFCSVVVCFFILWSSRLFFNNTQVGKVAGLIFLLTPGFLYWYDPHNFLGLLLGLSLSIIVFWYGIQRQQLRFFLLTGAVMALTYFTRASATIYVGCFGLFVLLYHVLFRGQDPWKDRISALVLQGMSIVVGFVLVWGVVVAIYGYPDYSGFLDRSIPISAVSHLQSNPGRSLPQIVRYETFEMVSQFYLYVIIAAVLFFFLVPAKDGKKLHTRILSVQHTRIGAVVVFTVLGAIAASKFAFYGLDGNRWSVEPVLLYVNVAFVAAFVVAAIVLVWKHKRSFALTPDRLFFLILLIVPAVLYGMKEKPNAGYAMEFAFTLSLLAGAVFVYMFRRFKRATLVHTCFVALTVAFIGYSAYTLHTTIQTARALPLDLFFTVTERIEELTEPGEEILAHTLYAVESDRPIMLDLSRSIQQIDALISPKYPEKYLVTSADIVSYLDTEQPEYIIDDFKIRKYTKRASGVREYILNNYLEYEKYTNDLDSGGDVIIYKRK